MRAGLLSETIARLRVLHGPALAGLRVEKAVVGVVFSGVKLSDGRGGLAGTPRTEEHPSGKAVPHPPGALAGLPVLSLLEPWPDEPFRRALAVAAVNALSAPWLEGGRYRVVYDRDALDLLELRPGMSVALVGAFSSYIDRLKAVAGLRLTVLELRESALREQDRALYAPASRAAQVVPACDALVITGMTVVNGTLEGLLSLASPKAAVIVVGPSGSLLPDALFARGVRWAGGCVVHDPDAALELLSQGARARHLYGTCARRINLAPLP
ncbi:MAG: DUF364 domain-containing protein [Elusimicrobia bacterium]|nr:DUF364 domain-containing protein [Elusimicrobiota bacterium]